jgi:tetratricopeptide (TPR) repeat protein
MAPTSIEGYQALGDIYLDADNKDMAISTYNDGLKLMPGAAALYASRGDVQVFNLDKLKIDLNVAQGAYTKAQDLLDKAHPDQRGTHVFYNTLVTNYYFLGAQLTRAQAAYKNGLAQLNVAMADYQKALSLQADNLAGLFGMGRALTETGKDQEGLVYYRLAATANPDSAQAYVLLGRAYLKVDQAQEAVTSFTSALKISPEDPGANEGLVSAHRRLAQYDVSTVSQDILSSQYNWQDLLRQLQQSHRDHKTTP